MSDDRTTMGETDAPGSDDLTVAFTPKQLFTGFAIVAGLILLATRRGRRSAKRADATSPKPGAKPGAEPGAGPGPGAGAKGG